jgi:hypothetical protein
MSVDPKVDAFLSQYDDNALRLREVILTNLPEIIEQIDLPARMIAYCYGQTYIEMICTIIPSKKGLKLGFYKGADLFDPERLLEGTGKNSRYINIQSKEQVNSSAVNALIERALAAYKQRMSK